MYTDTIEPHTLSRKDTTRKTAKPDTELPRTPESELMTVEEYFDIVWKRFLEKYEKLQG